MVDEHLAEVDRRGLQFESLIRFMGGTWLVILRREAFGTRRETAHRGTGNTADEAFRDAFRQLDDAAAMEEDFLS